MRTENVSRLWSKWAKGSVLTCAIVTLFCMFSAFQLEAKELYNGKSSDVFKDDSSEIGNEKILQTIVDELKKEKGVVTLQITLVCTAGVNPVDKSKPLGNERMEVLKKYFQQHLPGAVVTGTGRTATMPSVRSKSHGDPSSVYRPDILRITSSVAGTSSEDQKSEKSKKEDDKNLEPWQRELRERYKKVETQHQSLCQDKKREIEHVHEPCSPSTQSHRAFHLCLLRGLIYVVRYNKDAGSLYDVEYDMDRIMKLRETSPEVYAIAKEIIKKKPSAGSITYNSSLIDQEIERQILAKKHLKRALKKIDLGLKHLAKAGGADDNNLEIYYVEGTYSNWVTHDLIYATVLMQKNRAGVIDHVRELHNFVRTHLGLEKVDDNRFFPICVFTNVKFSEGYTTESEDKFYNRYLQHMLQKYGISEIPLE
jgi:hypothetical protein